VPRVDAEGVRVTSNDSKGTERQERRANFLTVKEVADWLRCSVRTVHRLRRIGLPDVKVGALVRFSEQDVLAWLEYERRGRRLFQISDEEMDDSRRRAAQLGRATKAKGEIAPAPPNSL